MKSYLCVFGRTPDLSWAELNSLFPNATRLHDKVGRIRIHGDESAAGIISQLGGTVLIAEEVGKAAEVQADSLITLFPETGELLNFTLMLFGDGSNTATTLLHGMKEAFRVTNRKTRYILPKHQDSISVPVLERENVQALVLVHTPVGYNIARAVAWQPYREWSSRDYDRPCADPKGGMLPPKVARMAVNIAAGPNRDGKLLVDPFCGMGTIQAEALLSGCRVIGSDLSEAVINQCQRNISWLIDKYNLKNQSEQSYIVTDATHISEKIPSASVDMIVTEPFMGSTRIGEGKVKEAEAKNINHGLIKLYIGCLRDWKKILKSGGKVFIALPSFAYPRHTYTVKKVIDMCEILGYTKLLGPIAYGRPQAVVRRDFYLLERQ